MLIISWNVAGLSTTLQRIYADYKEDDKKKQSSSSTRPTGSLGNSSSNNEKEKKKKRKKAFAQFVHRHGNPDILCIQEHKIPLSQLSSRCEPFQCSTCLEGGANNGDNYDNNDYDEYESFWSCCTDTSKKGFNGVVTFCKKGITQYATNTPFSQQSDFNAQGRCVMTDHGSFVVFNVYVPADGANPLAYKMNFLNELRTCMEYQRCTLGKKVILAGDLNICYLDIDKHWTARSINVNYVLKEVNEQVEKMKQLKSKEANNNGRNENTTKQTLPQWKVDIAKHWKTIETSLSTIEAIPVTTKNKTTGSTFDKFRARISIPLQQHQHQQEVVEEREDETIIKNKRNIRKLYIGKTESTKEHCLDTFTFKEYNYFDDCLQKDVIARETNVVPLDILCELMNKVGNVTWSTSTIRDISNQAKSLRKASPQASWLERIIIDDGMVDAFRHLYPFSQGRFTCWDQRTNNRFENIGIRIDYTMIDKSIAPYIDHQNIKLRCCNYNNDDFNTDEAALHAATASFQFQGASFDGGGIAAASSKALETQYFGEAHTGIIYTAPSYSDHVAVSLKLNEEWDCKYMNRTLQLDYKNVDVKKTQPHKSQKSISSFFGQKASSTVAVRAGGNVSRDDNAQSKEGTNIKVRHAWNVRTKSPSASSANIKTLLSKNSSASSTATTSTNESSYALSSSSIKNMKRKSSTGSQQNKKAQPKKKGTIHNFFTKK